MGTGFRLDSRVSLLVLYNVWFLLYNFFNKGVQKVMRNKIFQFILTTAVAVFFFRALAYAGEYSSLYIFYSSFCHKCSVVKKEVMPQIERKFQDKVIFDYKDIADINNYKQLIGLQEKYNAKFAIAVPVFFLNGHFLNGSENIKEGLENFIRQSLKNPHPDYKNETVSVDLVSRFKDFTVFAITGAGLIDGINPCAFTVIVFFMSFLAVQGYTKRQLFAIGISFICAVFITYLLIGFGAFGFLYRLRAFWYVSKAINICIGLFSIILGILAVYDFFKFKKTGQTEGLVLQLPHAVKNQIHKVVGMHYRVDKSKEEIATQKKIPKLIISALVTGFLVSLLEAVCTGQTYLPTISFILKTTNLRLRALGYLLWYNLMFIAPLVVIFAFALKGVTSEQFSSVLKKNLLTVKVLMALLFFGLGIFLLWRG